MRTITHTEAIRNEIAKATIADLERKLMDASYEKHLDITRPYWREEVRAFIESRQPQLEAESKARWEIKKCGLFSD